MNDYLIFNHHSLPFEHKDLAKPVILDFLKICLASKKAGIKTILVDETVDSSWFRIELAPGYFWKDWHDKNKANGNKDDISAFLSIATQSPFFNEKDIDKNVELFDVSLEDNPTNYSAIRAAAWHESPLIGFETRAPWNTSPLKIKICRLDSKTTDFLQEDTNIHNFYNYSQFSLLLPEILHQKNLLIANGTEIIHQFETLYPGVCPCGKIQQQLHRWSASLTILNQAKDALLSLSQFARKWQSGIYEQYTPQLLREDGLSFQVSGESDSVKNTPKLRKERKFWLPCGREEFFEQHIKLTSGYRIHFFPDNETKLIYVAYIGPHMKL